MDNKEILEKAIQKASDGGWVQPHGNTLQVDDEGRLFCFPGGATDGIRVYGYQFNVERLIFNHDFAKALWSEELIDVNIGTPKAYSIECWMYHLQQMVVANDPIKYLGENI